MQEFVRFAASFLSVLLLAGSAHAADLRDVKDVKQIQASFAKPAKLRLLNVWATWCVPCVAEMPDLRAIDAAFGPELSVVGISLDDMIPDAERKRVVSFLDKQKVAFPNLYYTGNPDDLALLLKFSGEIPITIVYDAQGKELWRHQGRVDKAKTIAQLRKLLGRKS